MVALLIGFGVGVIAYALVRMSDIYRRMNDQREAARDEWYSRRRFNETREWTR